MAAIASPYGFKPVQLVGGRGFSGGTIREVPMTANSAAGVFTGSLVALAAGTGAAIAATPTTTANGNTPIGVCVGVRYTDPVLKQTQHAQFLPANAITNGYTNVFLKVVDDPDCLFQVQATGTFTLGAAAIGMNSTLTGFGGSTVTGNANTTVTAGSTPALTATFAVRIIDIVDPAALFPEVIVKFNAGVHAYNNATGQ